MIGKTIAVVAALVVAVSACSGGEGTPDGGQPVARPDQPGVHGAGYLLLDLVDTGRDNRPLPTLVYYPASAGTVKDPAENAGADRSGAPYPLIMFSHGSGAQKEVYLYFYTWLASHGYVVAAMDHTGNVGMAQEQPIYIDMTIRRVFDVKFVMDQLAGLSTGKDGVLAGLVDSSRAGMAGHSYGGSTTLALAGAGYGWDFITESCNDPSFDRYCCPVPQNRTLLEKALPEGRIRAALTLAHDGAQSYFGPECAGGASLALPVMMFGGTADTICPYLTEAVPCFEKVSSAKYLLKLTGAGHVGFTDVFNDGDMKLDRLHAIIQRYAVAFFGLHLKGQEGYRAYLGAGWVETWNRGKNDFEMKSAVPASN
ncbi:MAG: hypothetical protein WC889_19940 [Myxococcota bacterium]|jgi:predicted dienelactone hydrolase